MKPWMKLIAIGLGCFLGALVLCGAIFEAIVRTQATVNK